MNNVQGALSAEDNAELLEVLAGLARDRSGGLDKRAARRAELAVLRLVLRSQLLIAVGADQQPLLLPSLLPRARGPGRVALVFTDEEAMQGWMDARRPEGPPCGGSAPISSFIRREQPDPMRWQRWLARAGVNLLSLNPAGPLMFSATTPDFEWAASPLVKRGATAPAPDTEGAWLQPSARAAVRDQARGLLEQLMRSGPHAQTEALSAEIKAVNRFGSRLFQSQLFLLPGRGTRGSKLQGCLGAGSAGDPCLAVDGLLEIGAMTLSALDDGELDERQTRTLRKQLKTVTWLLGKLADIGYRANEIEQLTAAAG